MREGRLLIIMLSLACVLSTSTQASEAVPADAPVTPCKLPVSSQQGSHDYPYLLTCEELSERLPELLEAEKTAIAKAKAAVARQEQAAKEAKRKAEEQAAKDAVEAEAYRNRITSPIADPHYITSDFRQAGEFWGEAGHDGLDFGVHLREDVQALSVAKGVVSFAGDASQTPYSGCGFMVVIWHESRGFSSVYCHLSSVSVSVGQTVEAGQAVGVIGTTGYSTGIHLHFMTVWGSDPYAYANVFNPREVINA